jgi:hypothetical protein
MEVEDSNHRKAIMILREKRLILACEQEITHHMHMIDKANGTIVESKKRITAIESGKMP